jgi:hypothetical protein
MSLIFCVGTGQIMGKGDSPQEAYENYQDHARLVGWRSLPWEECSFYKAPLPLNIEPVEIPVTTCKKVLIIKER